MDNEESLFAEAERMLAQFEAGELLLTTALPNVSVLSLHGYTLDTTFIYNRQVRTLRDIPLILLSTTEVIEDEIPATLYQATVFGDRIGDLIFPITPETYSKILLQGDENDSQAYDNELDITHGGTNMTDAQLKALQTSPKIITADRMSHLEPDKDAKGREKKFRPDTRFPAVAGIERPEYP